MPGSGTFHHLKEQQLTLQLFKTRCAWPHLPFPLMSTGNLPDTNHHHDPHPAKPIEGVSTGFSGSRWKVCVPRFPLPVQYLEPQSCSFCLTLFIAALVLGSQLFSLHPTLLEDSTVWWVGHKTFSSSGTCYRTQAAKKTSSCLLLLFASVNLQSRGGTDRLVSRESHCP